MSYETLILDIHDKIAVITFNRPKALNALNSLLFDELNLVMDKIESNEKIKAVVITGAGDKSFIAGADITELAECGPLKAKYFARKGQLTMARLQDTHLPVLAAVNGFALGGGLEMALSADFIYASDKAKFGLPEINLGLIPGFGGTQRLSRIVGKNMAKEMIFTGKILSADEALNTRLVNRVIDHNSLMDETLKTASYISTKGVVSLLEAKKTVNHGLDLDLNNGCILEAEAFGICFSSEDSKEGISAFLDKRKAEFKGSLK